MHNILSQMVVVASLVLVSGKGRAAEPDRALIASVHDCTQADASACRDLAAKLAARLEGMAPTDPALGLRLGMAAASAIEQPDRMVAGVAESCRVGYRQACVTLARVLDGLFTGDDARLGRSTDRLLARELAARLVAASSNSNLAFGAR